MVDLFHRLLSFYNITEDELKKRERLEPLKALSLPFNLDDFKDVINFIKDKINNKKKIVIYGDYDFDGLSATAILKRYFMSIDYECGFYIPSRYIEGYGLCKKRIDDFKKKDYDVIITVDNGISKNEEIEYASSLGIEICVIDHHLYNEECLSRHIFHQIKSGFLDYNCSAASLCLFISAFLRNEFDPYDVILAGIAVFSDVMELKGNNLILAKLALHYLNSGHGDNLKILTGNKKDITYDDISFSIIPALNAVGRIKNDPISNNNACKFLLDENKNEKTVKLASEILTINSSKKDIIKSALIKENLENKYSSTYVVESLSGLSGLLANKYMKNVKKPVAVFLQDEKNADYYVGSLRAYKNYNFKEFIDEPKKYFVNSGGHLKAMGITIKKGDLLQFCSDFLLSMSKIENKDEDEEYIQLDLDELNLRNYEVYRRFEPFSIDFEKPKFKIDVPFSKIKKISSRFTLAINKTNDGRVVLFEDFDNRVTDVDYYTFYGELKNNVYNGHQYLDLVVDHFEKNQN